jgi:hypothetical protein
MSHSMKRIAVAILLSILFIPGVGRAQDADATQRAFVERYVAALREQSREALKQLIHPDALACRQDRAGNKGCERTGRSTADIE